MLPDLSPARLVDAWLAIGDTHLQRLEWQWQPAAADYAAAVHAYRQAAQVPKAVPGAVADAELRIGKCCLAEQKCDDAASQAEKVLAVKQASKATVAGPHHLLGNVLAARRKHAEAAAEYELALAAVGIKVKEGQIALLAAADAYLAAGNYSKALAAYAQCETAPLDDDQKALVRQQIKAIQESHPAAPAAAKPQ